MTEARTPNGSIEVKFFEIRDDCTFIPVMCVRGAPLDVGEPGKYLLCRSGWGWWQSFTYLTCLTTCRTQYDPFKWGGCRTMTTAHRYIQDCWDTLEDGEVIDVEFILGEKREKKISERCEEVEAG